MIKESAQEMQKKEKKKEAPLFKKMILLKIASLQNKSSP